MTFFKSTIFNFYTSLFVFLTIEEVTNNIQTFNELLKL